MLFAMADHPRDIALTLNWKPETDLMVVPVEDQVSSHALVGGSARAGDRRQ
jgi:hypothetical protein